MTQNNKTHILAITHHDPTGKFNNYIKNSLSKLQEIFTHICISTTPPTIEKNGEFLNFLEKSGCIVYKNEIDSNIGDHYRNSLKTACDIDGNNKIFFGFIDRILFALNNGYSTQFIEDINNSATDMVLFERSEKAWQTHPVNYRNIEQTVNKLGSFLVGKEVELATCGFSTYSNIAKKILEQSKADSYSAGAEWILIAFLLGFKPTIKKVDWLSWEDPYIENIPLEQLKSMKETDKYEFIKRLEMNIPFIDLLVQKRFYDLLK